VRECSQIPLAGGPRAIEFKNNETHRGLPRGMSILAGTVTPHGARQKDARKDYFESTPFLRHVSEIVFAALYHGPVFHNSIVGEWPTNRAELRSSTSVNAEWFAGLLLAYEQTGN
jgi:hypothetical protein